MRLSLFILAILASLASAEPLHEPEVIALEVTYSAHEKHWSNALATHWGAERHGDAVAVPGGRADLATDEIIVEVDRLSSWTCGVGQVLWYSGETGKRPVLALIVAVSSDFPEIERTCKQAGIQLVWLVSAK